MQGLALHEVDPPWYQPRACALASISFAGTIACFTAVFFVYWSSWPIVLLIVFGRLTACVLCVMCARGFQRHRRLQLPTESLGSADRVSKPGAKRVVVDSVTDVAKHVDTAPTGLAQKEPNRNANAKPVLAKLKQPVGEKWIPNPFAFLQGTVRATNDAAVSVRDDVEVASTTDFKELPATQHDQTAGGSETWSPLAMLQRAISTIDGKTAAARADGHVKPTSLAEVAAAAAPEPAVTRSSSSAAKLPNTSRAGEVGPQSTMMKPVPRKARGSSTKLGEKLGYEPPTDAELQQNLLMNICELTLSVATLFILTTYASLQYQGSSIFIIFQAHTMIFPIIAMLLIMYMLIEYSFRAWVYYRLLDEGVLINFSDEETWMSFLKTSYIAWYIMMSTIILCVSIMVFTQWGALIPIGSIAFGLLAQIRGIRELEVNLVSVNKFVEKHPAASAQFLLAIADRDYVVTEDEVRLAFLKVKLAHALLKHDLEQKKVNSKENRKQHRSALRESGAVIDFAKLAAELKANPRLADCSAPLAEIKQQAKALGFIAQVEAALFQSRWATASHILFANEADQAFCKAVHKLVQRLTPAAIILIEIYTVYAFVNGETACTIGVDR